MEIGDEMNVEKQKNSASRAMKRAFSEILFVILPIIVLSISLGHRGRISEVLFSPEWSIISVVICGQAIIKLVERVFWLREPVNRWTWILFLSVVIVVLFIPDIMILTMVLIDANISIFWAITQIVFFFLTALLYWYAVFRSKSDS